ncbi:polysaccharide pyruvyl transferase family protein [Niallia sp. FSL K6-0212]|uniref:polysaccharide pyruvyl transferase family protein n=1 Tax=Niallia sp. FSL K6-0212 TaxID=2921423 RepID=UPI0030FB2302
MKKIGILTINDYDNYGNRLQNYASQEVLKSLGFSVETVIHKTKKDMKTSSLEKMKNLKGLSVSEISKRFNNKWKKYLYNKKVKDIKPKRLRAFKEFTDTYISETDYYITAEYIPDDLGNKYDYFVTGSDQVWNPTFTDRRYSTIDFLTFAPKEKRISYAASFGVSEIPNEFVEEYTGLISGMNKISVREQAGAEIVKKLTKKNATVLVDPTMMLTKDKWLSISKKPKTKLTRNKYLLTYFLGKQSKVNKKIINEIARKNNLEIINLADVEDKEAFITGPSEFIDFINSASVFCTNSFHGVVFSILLETPFIVFPREGTVMSMNSRIDTLLSTFNLQTRTISNINTNEQVFEMDYTHTKSILEKERKKAINFLKDALQVD